MKKAESLRKHGTVKFYRAIGTLLRKERKQVGYTQEDLSSMLGFTRSHLSNLERGCVAFSLHVFVRYCSFLSVDPLTILWETLEELDIKE